MTNWKEHLGQRLLVQVADLSDKDRGPIEVMCLEVSPSGVYVKFLVFAVNQHCYQRADKFDLLEVLQVTTNLQRSLSIVKMIEFLRADEGEDVTILCQNPDGNEHSVEASGDWNKFIPTRFTAPTLEEALGLAVHAKQVWTRNQELKH